jgi:hypothetical protein
MDQPAPLPVDPKERYRQQVRQVRSGCGGCLFVVLLGVLFLGGMAALKRGLRRGTLGESTAGMFVMGKPENHANEMLMIFCFTMAVVLFALSAKSVRRAIVQACLVLVGGVLMLVWVCYSDFEAMRPIRGTEVELVYLWPRPSVRIDVRGATLDQELDLSHRPHFDLQLYHLVITAGGVRYRSVPRITLEDARQFLLERGAKDAPR